MLEKFKYAGATALLCASLGCGDAFAAPLRFSVTGNGFSGSWISDSNPLPYYSDPHAGLVLTLNGGKTGSAAGAAFVVFYQAGNPDWNLEGYTLMTLAYETGTQLNLATSAQVYSGSEYTPQFSSGRYSIAPWPKDPASNLVGTLTIGPAAPAPLAGSGVLAALAALASLALTRVGKVSFDFGQRRSRPHP